MQRSLRPSALNVTSPPPEVKATYLEGDIAGFVPLDIPLQEPVYGKAYSYAPLGDFIQLKKNDAMAPPGHKGWKIHISIAMLEDTEGGKPAYVKKAWKALLPILMRAGVVYAKVAAPKMLSPGTADMRPGSAGAAGTEPFDRMQKGKEIIIYEEGLPADFNWQELLQNIENALLEADIPAGPVPYYRCAEGRTSIEEPAIPGSAYMYYELGGLKDEAAIAAALEGVPDWIQSVRIIRPLAGASAQSELRGDSAQERSGRFPFKDTPDGGGVGAPAP